MVARKVTNIPEDLVRIASVLAPFAHPRRILLLRTLATMRHNGPITVNTVMDAMAADGDVMSRSMAIEHLHVLARAGMLEELEVSRSGRPMLVFAPDFAVLAGALRELGDMLPAAKRARKPRGGAS